MPLCHDTHFLRQDLANAKTKIEEMERTADAERYAIEKRTETHCRAAEEDAEAECLKLRRKNKELQER